MHRTIFMLSVLVGVGYAGSLAAADNPVSIDGYAAIVNERIITVGEVMAFVQPVESQLRISFQGDELQDKLTTAFEKGLNALIERALILEDFEAMAAQIPEQMVDDQMQRFINERFNNNRAAFLKALENEGLGLNEWREQAQDQLKIMILRRREVIDRVIVSPAEVRRAYESRAAEFVTPKKVHLHMIVLNKGQTEEERAVKQTEAEEIRERIAAGEDFGKLARSSSEGSRAARGGDWGWMDPSKLRTELAGVASTLDLGKVSEVLEGGAEFYILQVDGRKNASRVPFSEAKGQIEPELRKAEHERLFLDWIKKLKRKHYVKVFESL